MYQWNKIESLDINFYSYGQFLTGCQNNSKGKNSIFISDPGIIGYPHTKKMKLDPSSHYRQNLT